MIRLARVLLASITVALVLTVAGCGAVEQPPLANTSWRLTGWAEAEPPPSSLTMTAQFEPKALSGKAGINQYNGTYISEIDGSLTIRLGAMTQMGGSATDMAAESTFVARLGAARGYRIDGTTLVLTDSARQDSLTFTKA